MDLWGLCGSDGENSSIDKAISILRQSDKLSEKTKSIISTEMIENLYQAEWSRLSFLEKIGIDCLSAPNLCYVIILLTVLFYLQQNQFLLLSLFL